MDSMFNKCQNLEKINFGDINTLLLKNMNQLFHNCKKLETLNISNFGTSFVIIMDSLFRYFESLKSMDILIHHSLQICLLYLPIIIN